MESNNNIEMENHVYINNTKIHEKFVHYI